MKALTVGIGVLMLAALIGCGAKNDHERQQAERAEKVMAIFQEYFRAVHEEVLPKVGQLDSDDVWLATARIFKDRVIPHKDLLMAQADADLAELPVFELGDRADWEDMSHQYGEPKALVESYAGVVDAILDDDQTDEDRTEEVSRADLMFMMGFWSAASAANSVWRTGMGELVGSVLTPDHFAVFALAPPIVSALDADAAKPVIVLETGLHIVIVELNRTEAGYYEPVKIEWLRRKSSTE